VLRIPVNSSVLQLLTYDLSTGTVEELPEHLTQGLPMPNGATNWPGTDDTFVLLTQVRPARLEGLTVAVVCLACHEVGLSLAAAAVP
jgi:hypothetical protein